MRTPTPGTESLDSASLDERAWALLVGASAAGRPRVRNGAAAAATAGLDGERALWADPAWLMRQGREVATAPGAPPAVRALLDLYAPLCAAGPERPFTIAHLGQSLDGHVATGSGDSYYVTGPDNVRHLHRLRALCAAVVVGAGTVARDDPQLTVRQVEGASPVRVILDPRGRLAARHRVFTDAAAATLVVHADDVRVPAPGRAEILRVPAEGGRLRLDALLGELHARGLWSVFVEGGGATVSSFLEAGLIDRLHVAVTALITGAGRRGLTLPARSSIAECLRPAHRVFAMGGDVLFDCDLRVAPPPAAASGVLARIL